MTEYKSEDLKKIKICDLGIANRCNFRCKMCYFWQSRHNNKQEMSIPDWKRFLAELNRYFDSEFLLNFSGPGEVLMREGVLELLEIAHTKFRVSLNTNGYLVDENIAGIIARNAESVSISLDGATAATHDHIRGMPGAYERAVSAVRLLRTASKDIVITINTVIMEQNLEEILDLIEWVESREINGIIFQAITMPFDSDFDENWYKNKFSFLWPKDPQVANKVLDEIIVRKQNGGKIVNSVKQLECFKRYFLNPVGAVDSFGCEIDRVLKVDRFGDVKFCDFSERVGNVRDLPLEEMFNSGLARQEREKAYNCKSPCHLLINCFHDQGGQ